MSFQGSAVFFMMFQWKEFPWRKILCFFFLHQRQKKPSKQPVGLKEKEKLVNMWNLWKCHQVMSGLPCSFKIYKWKTYPGLRLDPFANQLRAIFIIFSKSNNSQACIKLNFDPSATTQIRDEMQDMILQPLKIYFTFFFTSVCFAASK